MVLNGGSSVNINKRYDIIEFKSVDKFRFYKWVGMVIVLFFLFLNVFVFENINIVLFIS